LVRVEYRVHNSTLSIRIDDEGEGFDPAAVPDPTDPENLLRPSGRGIFYMRQFMSRVEFNPVPGGGTSVYMERDLQETESSDE
jgi:serine/threonine-protein kinase RsbW